MWNIQLDEAVLISDHRLVVACCNPGSSRRMPLPHTYRILENIDYQMFEDTLHRSVLFAAPASTPELLAEQISTVVSAEIVRIAPLKSGTRRQPKAIRKWLSREAIEAKRNRRRLERRFKKTDKESDRVICRKSFCSTTKLIKDKLYTSLSAVFLFLFRIT